MSWLLIQNSLLVALLTCLISMALGFVFALWLAGLPPGWRPLFFGAAIMALAMPSFLVTNCWLHFLGQTGVWHGLVPWNIYSLGGVAWILSLLLWPLSLLLVWGAWQRLERAQLESDTLVSGWSLIRALLFPLARGALVQAAVLTFVLALNNFAVPAILQVKVFPAEMWIRFNTEFDTLGALRLSWPLVVAPLLLMLWFTRHGVWWPHLEPTVPARLFRQQLGPSWFWSSGACALALCFCSVFLPLFQILVVGRTWTELPGALAAGQDSVWHSLWYATAAASLISILSLFALKIKSARLGPGPAKQTGARNRKSLASLSLGSLTVVGWLAFLLPGVLLGIGLIHAFNHQWSAFFYQSAGVVILAFVLRYFVIGWNAVMLALEKVDQDLIDAARLEGANRWQVLRHVVWPQITRPLLMAWYIVFLLCLWDVESLILVVPPGGETLALRIFNLLHYGHNAQVNALCLILLAVALAPLVIGKAIQTVTGRRLLAAFSVPFVVASCTPASNHGTLHSQLFGSVQIIGTRGAGVGQLNKPRSVAVDTSDNLYVVDMTGRVQKFSSNGVFLLSWQMPQTDLGKPKGMCRDREGNIVVLEPHYSRLNTFSPLGKLINQWGTHGTNFGQLSLPRAIAINSHREILVSEYQGIERIQKFVFESGTTGDADSSDAENVHRAPRCVASLGKAGTALGEFNRAEGLCVDGQDRLYVADSCNHRIQIFSSDGKFLRAYGKAGKGLGELSYPYDICVDSKGLQYVCEFGNSRIQVFDPQDRPIEIIGLPGSEPGQFSNPWSVALDSKGNLYVADSQNHRVQKLVRKS